jgi:thiol-disulfide isomerase/thioredoxin
MDRTADRRRVSLRSLPRAAAIAALVACAGLSPLAAFAPRAALAQPGAGDGRGNSKAPAEAPPIFARATFEEAMTRAQTERKLLVVKFTADWCPPCKMMDRTTWRDESLVAWSRDQAVVVAVDVDREPRLSQAYAIEAMPTVVIFRDGAEFERRVGYIDGPTTLSWLKDAREGVRATDRLLERIAKGERLSIDEREQAVDALLAAGRFDAAGPIALDLWKTMHIEDPSKRGTRVSFFAAKLKSVAEKDAPTRAALVELRDEAEASLRQGPSWPMLTDWLTLNDVLGDHDATLAWIERNRATEQGRSTLHRMAAHVEPMLNEREHALGLSAITKDPQRHLAREFALMRRIVASLPPDPDPKVAADNLDAQRRVSMTALRSRLGLMHAGLILDNRSNEAFEYRTEAIARDDSAATRVAFVAAALKHGVPPDDVRVWGDALLTDAATKPDAADAAADIDAARATLGRM